MADESHGIFMTTRWSIVLNARDGSGAEREALGTLCQTYWPAVYALVRRRGFDPETARDFTQEFFARILARDGFARARRERGRFRWFLAGSVRHFLADEWDRATAQKRGGGERPLSLDSADAEGRYLEVSAPEDCTPDRLFDRHWAEQLLGIARRRLADEFTAAGRAEVLEVLDQTGDPGAPGLARHAERMGLPLNTLKSHLHRARQRFAAIVREVVAETVATPAEVEDELRELLAACG